MAGGLANVRAERVVVPVWERGEAEGRILAPYPQPVILGKGQRLDIVSNPPSHSSATPHRRVDRTPHRGTDTHCFLARRAPVFSQ